MFHNICGTFENSAENCMSDRSLLGIELFHSTDVEGIVHHFPV
jgi:hypothetical protein